MILNNPAVLAQIIGFGIFLWVGLYVLVRGGRLTPLIVVSLAGLFAQAIFFGSGALTDTRRDVGAFIALQRATLWTSVLPAALWLHLSALVAGRASGQRRSERPIFPPLVVAGYTAAALLTVFGTVGDLIVDYTHPLGAPGSYVVAPGPGYGFYMLYLALAATTAFANLAWAWRAMARRQEPAERALRRQIGVLAGGALFFLAGALWITARKNWDLPISVVPGFLCLFVGLAALGYGVAHYGLLIGGQNVQRDFAYNFTSITALNLLYGGLLAAIAPVTVEGALALVALVTLTHTTFDVGRAALDALFFNRAERTARAEARDYATALGTAPVTTTEIAPEPEPEPQAITEESAPPADEPAPAPEPTQPADAQSYKAFANAVRRALTGLKSPPQLAKSPLLALPLVERRVAQAGQEDNRLNRAAALRELLIEQIEGLRPTADDGAEHRVGEAWRFYNVLYYPYVRELSRKGALAEARRLSDERRRSGQREPGDLEQVLVWLADVDEDTFYKWQRRASDTIAAILWEQQAAGVEQIAQAVVEGQS